MADPHRPARRGFLKASLAAALAPGLVPGPLRALTQEAPMRIACRFADQSFTITLEDNPTARDLFSLLPVDLTIEDYSTNEKIAYLPRKLSGEGAQPFGDEAAGDFCYYAPWGNIVFFYETYRYSRGLIRLGRLDGGIAPLLLRGEFPLRIDPAA
ncbi:cyclophilin-like fold protein [Thalassovita mangrovi]|nr:cyclophilin-like fold protein [Thalassovita mangrovi]